MTLVSPIYDGTSIRPVDILARLIIQQAAYWDLPLEQEIPRHTPLTMADVTDVTAAPWGDFKDKRGYQYGPHIILGFAGKEIRTRTQKLHKEAPGWVHEAAARHDSQRVPKLARVATWYVLNQDTGRVFIVSERRGLSKQLCPETRLCEVCHATFAKPTRLRGIPGRTCSRACGDVLRKGRAM